MFTAKDGVYRLKDLEFEGENLSYQSINKWENWFETHTKLKDTTTMFPMTYPNKTNRIFATAVGKVWFRL